jgi:hypothetical protein
VSTALANVQYKPTELDTMQLGNVLVKSGFFQDTRDVAQAIVKVLAGRELGFGPIASMQGVYIVKGRVTLSANLVGAAIQRSGKYGYRVETLTDAVCNIVFFEAGKRIGDSKFSLDDAKKAGLAGGNYDKFPRNMLFARALTNGARWYCPEVFNGPIYTPDELGAEVDQEGVVVETPTHTVDTSTGEVLEERPAEAMIDSVRNNLYQRYATLCEQAAVLGIDYEIITLPISAAKLTTMGVELAQAIKLAEEEVKV